MLTLSGFVCYFVWTINITVSESHTVMNNFVIEFHIFFFLCPIFKRSMSSIQEMHASTVCILSSIITEEIIFEYWHLIL